MRRNLIYAVIALFPVLLFSCKDKNSFTLSGAITNPGSVKTITLIQASASGIQVIDSTSLSEQGKFTFTRNAPYANLYRIKVGMSMFDFIAKNGDDIDFSANLTDPTKAYQIKGSEESDKIQEFDKLMAVYAKVDKQLSSDYMSKMQTVQGPDSAQQVKTIFEHFAPLARKNEEAYNQAALKFMNDNKTSLAGFYATSTIDSMKYEAQLIAYADAIKNNFPNNPAVQSFVKNKEDLKPISIGHAAPDFTTMGIDGKPVKLSDFKGKYVMLDFWASWCGPCRQENPNVVKQYALYKDKGLNILGISLDTKKEDWQQAVKNDKLTWNHASDLKYFNGPTEELYHIYAIPSNFIINPQGVIIAKNVTGSDLEEFLKKTFSKPQ